MIWSIFGPFWYNLSDSLMTSIHKAKLDLIHIYSACPLQLCNHVMQIKVAYVPNQTKLSSCHNQVGSVTWLFFFFILLSRVICTVKLNKFISFFLYCTACRVKSRQRQSGSGSENQLVKVEQFVILLLEVEIWSQLAHTRAHTHTYTHVLMYCCLALIEIV